WRDDRPACALVARPLAPRALPSAPRPWRHPRTWRPQTLSYPLAAPGVRNRPRPRDGWQRRRRRAPAGLDPRPLHRDRRPRRLCFVHRALDGRAVDGLGDDARELAGPQLALPLRTRSRLREPGVRRLVRTRRAQPRAVLLLRGLWYPSRDDGWITV